MAQNFDVAEEFVQLARLALSGRLDDVAALVRRAVRPLSQQRPDLELQLRSAAALRHGSVAREAALAYAEPLPVDSDSRLELLRREMAPVIEHEPIWPESVATELQAVLAERAKTSELRDVGLQPTKSLLFVGPPGVGKTLAARWLAVQLGRPLLTLDLAAVMSSFLGKTGANVRTVLDYARQGESVLLLDEFDAIAKRRDDSAEIGELKRLVTVLLQAVDDWPSDGVLIAATNHSELLDPAVWRRFERIVTFPIPATPYVQSQIRSLLGEPASESSHAVILDILTAGMLGYSNAEIERLVTSARRRALIEGLSTWDALANLAALLIRPRALKERLVAADHLLATGYSARQVSEFVGVARNTLSSHFGQQKRRPERRPHG